MVYIFPILFYSQIRDLMEDDPEKHKELIKVSESKDF